MSSDVKQVYFSRWSDKSSSQEYWRDVGNLAFIIGTLLEGNGSTIDVRQYKEKFGEVRVYCSLAHPTKVEALARYKCVEYTEEFANECLVNDAHWYREVHKMLVTLLPHYKKVITAAADYDELLVDTEEELQRVVHRSCLPEDKLRFVCRIQNK